MREMMQTGNRRTNRADGATFRLRTTLAFFALVLVALLVAALAAVQIDGRTIDGVSVWAKPAKFLAAIAIHVLTFTWALGYVSPEKREAPVLRGAVLLLIGANIFELAWIGWQAAHGLHSHFNDDTPFFTLMYALMGLAAVAIVAVNLPLALMIWRHPKAGIGPDFRTAIIIGLVSAVLLGGGFGIYMSAQPGHAVGAVGGHFPLFGWNRLGGDLRVAHFLGIHAEQFIPLAGFMAGRLTRSLRWPVLLFATAAYVALTIFVFIQALEGRPFLHGFTRTLQTQILASR